MIAFAIAMIALVIVFSIYICGIEKLNRIISNHLLIIILLSTLLHLICNTIFQTGYTIDINVFKYWANMSYTEGISNFYTVSILQNHLPAYPPGYIYILYVLGMINNVFHLDANAFTFLIKLAPSLIDVLSTILVYKIANRKLKSNRALLISLAYVFNPGVIFTSAGWGQIDSLYVLVLLISIYCITEKKYLFSFLAFTVGLLIKPQFIMFAPVYLFVAYKILFENKFNKKSIYLMLQYIFCSVLVFVELLIPFTRNLNFMPIIQQYRDGFNLYPYASVNAYNFYTLIGANWKAVDQTFLHIPFYIWGTVSVIAISLFTMWLLIKRKVDLFLAVAVVNVLVFMFSVQMHERYMFPALAFFLVSYIYTGNKKTLLFYVSFSVTYFLNCLVVYLIYMSPDNHMPTLLIGQLLSITNMILTITMINFVIDMKKKKVIANLVTSPQNSIWKSKTSTPLTKRDYKIILFITIVYALIAFFKLGNACSPQNTWFANKSDEVTIDFGREINLERMQFMTGIRPNKMILFQTSDDGEVWREAEIVDTKSIFCWHDNNFKHKTRFVKLIAMDDDVYIQEMAFRDSNNKITKLMEVSDNGRNLFDEQQLVPMASDFMNSTYFDEVYHPRTAYEFLHRLEVYEWTHPPLGKDIIALGIKLFGMTPFGWRFFGTLCGVMMLPAFYILARKIFERTLWATFATVLFAFDFMHFAQTRIATIDSYTTFFIILMYVFAFDYFNLSFYDTKLTRTFKPLFWCGVCFGLAVATKWQGAYAFAGIIAIFIMTLAERRREFVYAKHYAISDITNSYMLKTTKTLNMCLIFFGAIPIVIYLSSYFMYIRTPNMNGPNALLNIVNNQNAMYGYHSLLKATHPFSSRWWQWILNLRPILFYNHTYSNTVHAGISSFLNPTVCYGGLLGLIYCVIRLCKKFDRVVFFIVVGFLAQYLPWVAVGRVTFAYHYFPSVPFLILMLTYFVKEYAYPKWGMKFVIGYVLLTIVLFVMFYPVLTGLPVNISYVNRFLRWFSSWQLY